jgi:hypothetical protein
MALVTGTPLGNLVQQEDLFVEGAPTFYFQDNRADPLFNPDGDGFYWQLSGTSTYPAYQIGCVTDVNMADNRTLNDVLCDNIGVKDTIEQRNYVEWNMTVQSIFPFTVWRHLVRGGAVTQTAPTEKFGFGPLNNSIYYMLYSPKVYDDSVGDYVAFHFHRCKFVDAWTLNTPFGAPWQLTGVKVRAFVDESKPSDQQFGVAIRSDASVIT